MNALAVFLDKTNWQNAWLKRGFRHVLVAIEIEQGTVVVLDAAGGGLHVWAGACTLEQMADYYIEFGAIVVETKARPAGALCPTPWTCVEMVKRALGVRDLFILTPLQLYRRLK